MPLHTALDNSGRKATPPDAPNRFIINVMPEQGDACQQQLRDAGVRNYDWFPMIRGRLVAVNGKTITPDNFTEDRAKRTLAKASVGGHLLRPSCAACHAAVSASRSVRTWISSTAARTSRDRNSGVREPNAAQSDR